LLPIGETTSKKNEYVIRVAYLPEVLTGGELTVQALALAHWIADGFERLAKHVELAKTARDRLRARATYPPS